MDRDRQGLRRDARAETAFASHARRLASPAGRLAVAIQPHAPTNDADAANLTAMVKPRDILPYSLPPRGLSRIEAAAYIGVSATLFDAMVKDGRMPGPKKINGRNVWDRVRLDAAFEALPGSDRQDANPWDE
jgi:predicted DNA-binding transcriptional regulator AlpA